MCKLARDSVQSLIENVILKNKNIKMEVTGFTFFSNFFRHEFQSTG
jgi:hypothetical protein